MRTPGICAVLLAVLAVSVPSRSAEASTITLDQNVLASGASFGSGGLAQTFTVGLTGGLVGVDVAAYSMDANVTFYLLGTTGGVPDANKILTSSVVSIPFLGGVAFFQPTIFFSPISVSAGDVLAIAIVSNFANGHGIGAWAQATAPYSGGEVFNIPDAFATNRFVALGADVAFRTYVDTSASTPVPEPASLSLLGLGLAAAMTRRRRRKEEQKA